MITIQDLRPDTLVTVFSVVFAAGIVVARLAALDKRVERLEKALDTFVSSFVTIGRK